MQAWFFIDDNINDKYVLTGENAIHAKKSLRMKEGEIIILCDKNKYCYKTEIKDISTNDIYLEVKEKYLCENEPSVSITLYQALTKGDKMDTVIQKAVELGISEITPVVTERCISRPDNKSMDKKIARWQKIGLQAAMQSRRGIIPKINNIITLKNAGIEAKSYDFAVVFYENGGKKINEIVKKDAKTAAMFVGCEGGFSEEEINYLNSQGVVNGTLGPRILRTETAPLMALSIIMYITDNI